MQNAKCKAQSVGTALRLLITNSELRFMNCVRQTPIYQTNQSQSNGLALTLHLIYSSVCFPKNDAATDTSLISV